MSVPERFKWFRLNVLKMTQEEVASSVGAKQSAVGNWETGRNLPAADTLWNLMKLHDLDAKWLFTGQGSPTSKADLIPIQVSGNIKWDIGSIDIPADKLAEVQASILRIATEIENLKASLNP